MARRASVRRKTGETDVSASASLDGSGKASVSTGIRFVDHLLGSLAKHSMIDLTVKASSLDGISHHLIEDAGISIGQAIDKALGARTGIARFGHASVPLDESLSEATVDLVRRPYCKISLSLKRSSIEGVPREDLEHLFSSLLFNTSSCIHVAVKYGDNDHHKVESAIKSVAVALRQAASRDPRQKGSPSTKGKMVA